MASGRFGRMNPPYHCDCIGVVGCGLSVGGRHGEKGNFDSTEGMTQLTQMYVVAFFGSDLSVKFTISVGNRITELVLYIWLVKFELEFERFKGFDFELFKKRTIPEADFIASLLKIGRDTIFYFSDIRPHASLVEAFPFGDIHDSELADTTRGRLDPR